MYRSVTLTVLCPEEVLHGDQVHSPVDEPRPERVAASVEAEVLGPRPAAQAVSEGTFNVLQGPARSARLAKT